MRVWSKKNSTSASIGNAARIVSGTTTVSAKGATFAKQADNSLLVSGKNELSDVYTVQATTTLDRVTGLRLEVLPDKSLVKNGPGRADNGNFVLTTIRAIALPAKPAINDGDSQPMKLHYKAARADFSGSRRSSTQ